MTPPPISTAEARTDMERHAPLSFDARSRSASRPVRVALLATSVEFGGIERVLLNLVQHMDSGVELVPLVFTRTDITERSFFERLQALGVPHETVYVNSVRPYAVLTPLVNLAQIIALVRKGGFDLIHSHGYRADVFGLAVASWCRLPIVSTCHGFIGNDARLRFYNALDRRVLKRFTRVMAVSARMKDDLVAHGLDAERVHVIANAVAEPPREERARTRRDVRSALGVRDDEFVFGYVGRLSEEKGVHYLMDAFTSLPPEHGATRLLIVGDGPRRQELEQHASERGVASRVTFTGFQSDTSRWYSAMDAFVLPSLTEGTPMALLEAMAYRVPVIASAVGGVPAMLSDRENGILIPPGDVGQLGEAMQMLTATPILRETLSEAGLRSVRSRYDVASWVRSVRDVYHQTLASAVRTN
jgi:glycosyltransferase involved in cell wall biosynthesis